MGYRRRFYRRGFGYGYERGYGPGFGRGFGAGYGRGFGYYGDPTKCAKFPDLPRWWWANPEYEGTSVPPVPSASTEREYLEGSMKSLEQELADIKKRLAELSTTDKS
jgi:hypothetical protein